MKSLSFISSLCESFVCLLRCTCMFYRFLEGGDQPVNSFVSSMFESLWCDVLVLVYSERFLCL